MRAPTTVMLVVIGGCVPSSADYGPASLGPGPLGTPPGPLTCETGQGPPLPADARSAVERALLDERRSELLYETAAEKLAGMAPFPSILVSQRRHSAELERLLVAHGHDVPPSPPPPRTEIPMERAGACALAASTERAKLALYDALLTRPLPEQVSCVFERMRFSSTMRQLPAFETCAAH